MHDDEVPVDEELARRLLVRQRPDLADRTLFAVSPWGTDNAIFRLGDDHVVRLPRIHWAAGQPEFEARWLPVLAPHLSVAIPEPVFVGEPDEGYPYRWAIHRWLPGVLAGPDTIDDRNRFARDLARVVKELRAVPIDGAPEATNRSRPIAAYDTATRRAIESARHLIDAEVALALWEDALAADPHPGPPVWVQGDLEGNCLVSDGRLTGIVDWGSACAGDPAVDVHVIWSPLFTPESADVLLDVLGVDDATLRRARGAAVNQACAALPYYQGTYPLIVERCRHKLRALGVTVRPTVA